MSDHHYVSNSNYSKQFILVASAPFFILLYFILLLLCFYFYNARKCVLIKTKNHFKLKLKSRDNLTHCRHCCFYPLYSRLMIPEEFSNLQNLNLFCHFRHSQLQPRLRRHRGTLQAKEENGKILNNKKRCDGTLVELPGSNPGRSCSMRSASKWLPYWCNHMKQLINMILLFSFAYTKARYTRLSGFCILASFLLTLPWLLKNWFFAVF